MCKLCLFVWEEGGSCGYGRIFMGSIACNWNSSCLGGDDFFADPWICWHFSSVLAWALDFVFCGGRSLADAKARLRGGVVDLCRAWCFADLVSGV